MERSAGGGKEGGEGVAALVEEENREGIGSTRDSGLGEAARELKRTKWRRWLESGFYGKVVSLKLDGVAAKEELDLGRSEWRALENRAKRYLMVEGRNARLIWKEKDGHLAACVLEDEVEKVLRDLHDGHGHFAAGITGGGAHGRYFWPTRQRDIGLWVASCEPCQRMTRIQRSGQIRPILQFSPMDMIGMDFIGPINPPCGATGAVYILLVVDYFSRFLFGAPLQKADQLSTMQVIVERIVPVVGWPKSVYSDNGTHFTGAAIKKMWEDHGVQHFTAAVSHPQSVGLSERYVQMTMGRIRLKCIERGTSRDWGLLVKDAVIDINTRCVRIHGYTPSEILLGYNAVTSRRAVIANELGHSTESDAADRNWIHRDNIPIPEEDTIHVRMDTREERGDIASQRLSRSQDAVVPKESRGYRKPKVGDLVLVRDTQLAKDKGRKLEPRWTTPRILERMSTSGVSGHVRQLHDPPGKTKRYHLDDLIPYVSRGSDGEAPTPTVTPTIEYTRDSLGDVPGRLVGQRAYDLGDLRSGLGRG